MSNLVDQYPVPKTARPRARQVHQFAISEVSDFDGGSSALRLPRRSVIGNRKGRR